MTASVVYSENVTKLLAGDGSIDKKIKHGKQIDQIALETTSLDEAGDKIFLCPIPSNAVITGIKVLCDDLDSHATPALVAHVGLVYSGIGGNQKITGKVLGTAADVDVFAASSTIFQAAITEPKEIRFATDNIVDIKKEAWDVAGLSADPGGYLLVSVQIVTAAATAAAGDLVVIAEYI